MHKDYCIIHKGRKAIYTKTRNPVRHFGMSKKYYIKHAIDSEHRMLRRTTNRARIHSKLQNLSNSENMFLKITIHSLDIKNRLEGI